MCQRCYWRWKTHGSTGQRYYTCPKNHVLSPDNIVMVRGQRRCAACLAAKPPPGPCVIASCPDPEIARGWCRKHYLRWWRTGTTDDPPPFTPKPCGHPGCPVPAVKLGLCVKHHARWKARGTTEDPPPRPAHCLITGCGLPPRSRGWCKKHYKQLTGQGAAHEMRRYALKRGSQAEPVSYEAVIAAHGMVCHLCKLAIPSRADLQIDHVVPLARGGSHAYGNLRPTHGLCNRRKHAKLMSELTL
jgi:5-methylcytosine-specific restriction endonuclease McrA